MLGAVVRWSLLRPRLVAAGALLLLIAGVLAAFSAKYDVLPDFTAPQAEIQTEAPGLTAGQVEQLVTLPVEQAVAGAAGVAAVRSESIQGLSVVTVVFAEGADPYRARQVVAEALAEGAARLPAGVASPKVSPLTSATMDLIKIGFVSDRLSPMELRDLVQWTVRPRLLAAPGVARATVYGGEVRRLEVRARPAELAAHGVGFNDLIEAVRQSTGVTGGGYIDTPEQRILIEVRGQAMTPADIAASPIGGGEAQDVPLTIGDVAQVVDGTAPLVGDAVVMGRPGVLISVSSQYGANTLDATRSVEAAFAELRPTLEARGVKIYANLHRPANFIAAALSGISEDLVIGGVLIAVVLFLFMRDIRTAAISFVSVPLALLTAVLVLNAFGVAISTMTLGGLAVALGVVVDDAVIDVENIVRRLRLAGPGADARAVILGASLEVRAPVVYATLVLVAVLMPVLLLKGLQGAFFAPLAVAFIVATLASLAVAIIVTPALAFLMLRNARLHEEPRFLAGTKAAHQALLSRVGARPNLALALGAAALALTLGGLFLFDTELLPSFREGHFVLGVAARPGTSLAVMRNYGEGITRDILKIDGVDQMEQQIGRAEGGEDTWGTEQSEFHIELKPKLSGARQDEIGEEIHEVLDGYPGLETEVMTFLTDRIGESLSGETASLAVGVYGADLDTLDRVAADIAAVMEKVPGATDVVLQTPPSTPAVRVDLDHRALARYGLSAGEALEAVQAAFQGAAATQLYQEDRAIDVAVTLPADLRQDPEAVGDLLIRGRTGVVAPLREVAHVALADGRTLISHEGGRLRQVVTANPPPAKAERVTKAVREAIAAGVKLPPGVYLDFSGTAKEARAARRDLALVTALAAAAVVVLLLLAFRNGRTVVLILASAPFALAGGVIAVGLTGAILSLGSLVGFITLFGISTRNAILLAAHVDHLLAEEGCDWSFATLLRAARERVTPILMTALVTALGVAPLAVESGQAGREIQGPMAIVILGGLVTSTLAALVLLPALIGRYGRRERAG